MPKLTTGPEPPSWLRAKLISTVPRGAMTGTPVAKFDFSESIATNGEIRDIFDFMGMISLRSRAVLFQGSFPDQNNNAFSGIVRSLADAGITTFVLSDGSQYQSFFTDASVYTIVTLDDPEWASFPCRELHYRITSGSTREPVIPVKCVLNYLIPGEDVTIQQLMTFIASSKVNWKIGPRTETVWNLRVKED